ncbi:MAG: hypothetical protein KC917_02550 [Candidatus Omnitrophica bacterium]|nr:hypothetical protein [Candidatus Omnitrophota bacterium]
MNSKKPLVVVGLILLVAIGVSLLLSQPNEVTPPIQEVKEPEHTVQENLEPTEVSPRAQPTEEIELASTDRMTIEEGQQLIREFREKVRSATSVSVNIEFQLSQKVRGEHVEGEIRFASFKPERVIREIESFQPAKVGRLSGDWEKKKIEGFLLSATKTRTIDYPKHTIDDFVFDSTNETIAKYGEICRKNGLEILENPLQDLLVDIPLEERLREVIRATLIRSSQGDEIHIVSRMPHAFIETFDKGLIRKIFPHTLGTVYGQDVALRTDIYDAKSRTLKETLYSNIEKKDLVKQIYTKIDLNADGPADRFNLDLPTPANIRVLNEILENKNLANLDSEESVYSVPDILGATEGTAEKK